MEKQLSVTFPAVPMCVPAARRRSEEEERRAKAFEAANGDRFATTGTLEGAG
jgi:hypothetical protein